MNEKPKQVFQIDDDDPLAELARIVAGEPHEPDVAQAEPEPEADLAPENTLVEAEDQDVWQEDTDLPANAGEISSLEASFQALETEFAADLEEQLATELPNAANSQEPPVEEALSDRQADMVSEIAHADFAYEGLDNTAQNASSHETTDMGYAAPDNLEALPAEAVEETSFDQYKSAVSSDEILDQEEPDFVREINSVLSGASEVELEESLAGALEQEFAGFEPEITEETSIAPVNDADLVPDVGEPNLETIELADANPAISASDEVAQALISTSAVMTEEPVGDAVPGTASQRTGDDLGAAFANEFEALSQAEPVYEPQTPELPTVSTAQHDDAQLADLDFSQALAAELESSDIDNGNGWDAGSSLEASGEFVAAAGAGSNDFSNAQYAETAAYHAPYHDDGVQQELESVQNRFDEFESINEDPGHLASMGEEAAPARKVGVPYSVAALVIAIFAGVILAGYGFLGSEGSVDGDVPIIKADSEPVKVKPDNPGGIEVANQDKASYGRVEGSVTEEPDQDQLVSVVEEPAQIDVNLSSKDDGRLVPGQDDGQARDNSTTSAVKPRVVSTVVVKPDGTIVPGSSPRAPEAPRIAAPTASGTDLAPTRQVQTTRVDGDASTTPSVGAPSPVGANSSIDGARTTGTLPVPAGSPRPTPEAATNQNLAAARPAAPTPQPVLTTPAPKPATPAATATTLSGTTSQWVVQVSSQRSQDAAQASMRSIGGRYPMLQGRSMGIQRAKVNGATYFRVRVNTTSREDANRLCNNLKAQGGSCFVTRS